MYCLQALGASTAVIFLGFCLQLLPTGEAADIQKLLEVNVVPTGPAKPGEKIELACSVQSYWTDCAPVKVHTLSNPPIDFPLGNLNYTYCACPEETRTFYWTIQSNKTVNVGCRAVFQLDDVCPEGQNSIPPRNKRRYDVNMKTLKIIK
ncbi:prolactin-inducible protein homolog [Dromiciops gliroides]|uniref:prolactin-inducible protein homolog n=1 Tax=Dromiciops gliroides TaxID=33562 RepID=UPI001CC640F5|nr:prolactin-inducible protein homolog [Dromiciops gliroides]